MYLFSANTQSAMVEMSKYLNNASFQRKKDND